jgi:hypothetical protein
MHAKYWLIGCAMCIASIGNAAASNRNTQDLDSSSHAVSDASPAHDDGVAGGDVVGLSHNCTPRDNSHETPGNTSGNSDHISSSGAAPAPAHQQHLGWQSLLPGSIQ